MNSFAAKSGYGKKQTYASAAPTSNKTPSFTPTQEQATAVQLASTREDLSIEAYAGTGKTSTLTLIADSFGYRRRGFYLAFNKSIADEASRKFPNSVECRTAHSLAFRAVGRTYADRLRDRLTGRVVAQELGLTDNLMAITSINQGYLLLEMISNYCNSADAEITPRHAPYRSILKALPREYREADNAKSVAQMLVKPASELWERLSDPRGTLPITHDVYLKVWSMRDDAVVPGDYILFDETQDASPIMLSLVQRQSAQKIYVGDRFQQIYSWRGAVNAMLNLDTKHRCALQQSFRFGQEIAETANRILAATRGARTYIKGVQGKEGRVGSLNATPRAVICRTNAGLIEEVAKLIERGQTNVYIEGGVDSMLKLLEGASNLLAGKPAGVFELQAFQNWQEVEEYVESGLGADLATLVKLVAGYEIQELQHLLRQTSKSGRRAEITVSTAHKSKGLEFDSVLLGDDFKSHRSENYNEEEGNLLYVAATRAKIHLDGENCSAFSAVFK